MTIKLTHTAPTFSGGTFAPPADGVYDLGSEELGWRNIYLANAAQSKIFGDAGIQGALTVLALTAPTTPTITNEGTAGSTTYGYKVTATVSGQETEASSEGTTATGNVTLDSSNFNRITWAAISGATGYQIYRSTGGGTQGLIATITTGLTLTLDDTGLSGSGAAPSTNDTGRLTVDAAALVLGEGVAPAVTDVYILRDNTGDITLNALSGKTINLAVNGVDIVVVSATAVSFSDIDITNVGNIVLDSISAAATNITIDTVNLSLTKASSTVNTTFTVENTTNSDASNAIVDIKVGGTTSTGDPQVRWTIPSGTSWYAGIDNSDSDSFSIGTGTTIGSNRLLEIDPTVSGSINFIQMLLPSDIVVTLSDGAAAGLTKFATVPQTIILAGTTTVTTTLDWTRIDRLAIAQSGGAVTVNAATALALVIPTADASVTIVNTSGLRIREPSDGGGSETNQYGILIETLTNGANNYGIYINTPTGTIADAIHVVGGRTYLGGGADFNDQNLVNVGNIVLDSFSADGTVVIATDGFVIADTKGINTGVVDDDYLTMGAVENSGNTITELVRLVGATAPYFKLSGALFGAEITTPTAVADVWAIYAKTNNRLFFQDGAGVEHELALV